MSPNSLNMGKAATRTNTKFLFNHLFGIVLVLRRNDD